VAFKKPKKQESWEEIRSPIPHILAELSRRLDRDARLTIDLLGGYSRCIAIARFAVHPQAIANL
jgi:hypothetical protein